MNSRLGRLCAFYIDCLDLEDRQSLTLALSGLHRSFISPWVEGSVEELLSTTAIRTDLSISLESNHSFLTKGALEAGDPSRLFYGYPMVIDAEDYVSPLFFLEVEASLSRGDHYQIVPSDVRAVRLNHHIFRKLRYPLEEIQEIQTTLEGDFGSFQARLSSAFDLLGVENGISSNVIAPMPRGGEGLDRWLSRPILFRSDRSAYTAHLRRELDALRRIPRVQEGLAKTVLGALLDGQVALSAVPAGEVCEIVPLNAEQARAAQQALTAPLTLVTGPPGTGKSQIIVDVLATYAREGKPVLFVSKNNKAVDVVCERLHEALAEDDWSLRLGSKTRVDETQATLLNALEELASRPTEAARNLEAELKAVRAQRHGLEAQRDKIAAASEEYARMLARERTLHFALPEAWQTSPASRLSVDFDSARRTVAAAAGREPIWFTLWLQRFFRPRALRVRVLETYRSVLEQLPEPIRQDLSPSTRLGYDELLSCYDKLNDYSRWIDTVEKLSTSEELLSALPEARELQEQLDLASRQFAALSRRALRTEWSSRLKRDLTSTIALARNYFDSAERLLRSRVSGADWFSLFRQARSAFDRLGKALPIWIVTSLSVRRTLPLDAGIVDLVVIDEASQCDIASALPLLYRAKRAVIIGDPRQLRHITTIAARDEEQLAAQHGVLDDLATLSYARRSLYDFANAYAERVDQQPIMLVEHYRSHPEVIEFSNRSFYSGELVVRTDLGRLRTHGEAGVFWHDVSGKVVPGSRSATNTIEVDAVVALLESWRDRLAEVPGASVGVVTPFRRQADALEKRLLADGFDNVLVGTAHRFQGDERDVMIFSPVVSSGMPERLARWVADTDQLLNVAVTRARGALHIVGDRRACLAAGGYISALAEYVGDPGGTRDPSTLFESDAEEALAGILERSGLWYRPQVKIPPYRVDFLAISPFGKRWIIEVDGKQHLRSSAIDADATRDERLTSRGYHVLRLRAGDVIDREDAVLSTILRL